jgi:hypothetical protein
MAYIIEKQIVDYQTGETTSITTLSVKKFAERFVLCRKTNGLGWVNKLSGTEIKLLINLLEFENLQTHVVSLSKLQYARLCEMMNLTKKRCQQLLVDLEAKHALGSLTDTDFILNPAYFYQGESKDVLARINDFYIAYNDKHGTSLTLEEDMMPVDNTQKPKQSTTQ